MTAKKFTFDPQSHAILFKGHAKPGKTPTWLTDKLPAGGNQSKGRATPMAPAKSARGNPTTNPHK